MTNPSDMPRHSLEHLIWRLESVNEDAKAGWFLFRGEQVKTLVGALKYQQAASAAANKKETP
jgi:hypothetical protein